ncbi:MAG: hypothetical protein HQL27_05200, partial [Candidatus Omnitrophica bacterium]|nr:hypothetical protein [Candidatus Omnitrophota bacterium]
MFKCTKVLISIIVVFIGIARFSMAQEAAAPQAVAEAPALAVEAAAVAEPLVSPQAAEVVDEMADQPVEDFEFTDGKVVKVEGTNIEILEYDFEEAKEVNAVYATDKDTIIEDYESIEKI